jgi:hypothetical protein
VTEQHQQRAGTPDGDAAAAVPPQRGPVPDLGFFTGTPQPREGAQLGGAPATSRLWPPPSQFGGPFGAPPPPGQAVPAPPAARSGGSSGAARIARRIAVPVVVLLVLGLFGIGRFSGLAGFFAGDMTVPESLRGLPRSSEELAVSMEEQIESGLEDRNSGDAVVGFYGGLTQDAPMLYFAGQRTRVDIDRELADAGTVGAVQTFGDNTCATALDGMSVCVQTSASTTVVVGGTLPVEEVAAAADEAWSAQ